MHNSTIRIEHWEGGYKDKAEVVLFCNVTPLRWLKSFQGCLSHTVGVMGWLFSYYVVRNISAWLDEVDESKPQILWSLCFDSWSVSPWSFISLNDDPNGWKDRDMMPLIFRWLRVMMFNLVNIMLMAWKLQSFSNTKVIQEGWSVSIVKSDTLLLLRAMFIASLVLGWEEACDAKYQGKGEEIFKDRLCGMHRSAFVEERGVRVSCEIWKTCWIYLCWMLIGKHYSLGSWS